MIYYLEDDEQIRNLALYTLEQTGHATRGFSRASEMDVALAGEVPDLFLLDVMLPDEDGISVLKRLRADSRTANVPIMMLTAKSTEFDTVCGLDAGADDYLAKPFGMMELISRVNALLRRHERDVQAGQREMTVADDEDVLEAGPICSRIRNSKCCVTSWRIAASWCRATCCSTAYGATASRAKHARSMPMCKR